jgi:hypothetical protein
MLCTFASLLSLFLIFCLELPPKRPINRLNHFRSLSQGLQILILNTLFLLRAGYVLKPAPKCCQLHNVSLRLKHSRL